MADYLLEMRGITKEFSGVKAIDGIDLKVRPGECVGLCGENGAGKSTLMKVLSAVYPPGSWSGTILWEGEELKARNIRETEEAGIVIIHQELMMVPHLSVAENIFLGSEPTTFGGLIDYDAMNARAAELMIQLKMPDINVALPVMAYSGGKQQLIEIAKALNKNAKLLILDEPTSALTSAETRTLLDLVAEFKARGMACVYISHKLDEVAEIADTVTVIRDGTHVATRPMAELTTDDIITMMVGREMKNLFPREGPRPSARSSSRPATSPSGTSPIPIANWSTTCPSASGAARSSASPASSAPAAPNSPRTSSAAGAASTSARSCSTARRSASTRPSRRCARASAWCRRTVNVTASCR